MDAGSFDFKDYFTLAGSVYTMLFIFFILAWFVYDLKTKFLGKEGRLRQVRKPDETQEEESLETDWLDKKLMFMTFTAPIIFYGLYFVLYYSCRVFHQPVIAMVYWLLCGIYPVVLLIYILVAEWHHEEIKYGEVSFYQVLTGHPITVKLKEMRDKSNANGRGDA